MNPKLSDEQIIEQYEREEKQFRQSVLEALELAKTAPNSDKQYVLNTIDSLTRLYSLSGFDKKSVLGTKIAAKLTEYIDKL